MAELIPDAARQAAYEQLLAAATKRGDRGASDQMMADRLNAVDMLRGERSQGYWDQRQAAMETAGQTMLTATAAALKAARARAAAGGSRGGGGGGGGSTYGGYTYDDPLSDYIDWLMKQNSAPPAAPRAVGWGAQPAYRS